MTSPVVITGMGTVNPLGLSVEESWQRAVAGTPGVGPITLFDHTDQLVHIASEVKGFDPAAWMDGREARRRDRFEHFALAAARQAVAQAGLPVPLADGGRAAVIVSSAIGGLSSFEGGIQEIQAHGPRRVSPFLIPMFMANGASGMIGIEFGARGPTFSVASACASGADALGQAWMLLRAGVVDIALAGASEATITRVGISTFDRVGALSRRNDAPYRTPSPFDRERDGLVMGEGAAILVLERLEHAVRRGAAVLGELAGYASTGDAFHITAPAEDGAGGAAAIRLALESAGLGPADVGYVNAHGTGTVLNDAAETHAIHRALGARARAVPVSSTKSMTGHMMGATGALEAIFCLLAIRDGILPPTIHHTTPDPACDLDVVPNTARRQAVDIAVSNAFGFGGHNAVLVLARGPE
jgi:beta-ketoacyl-acyl-carrier-protein synthase II